MKNIGLIAFHPAPESEVRFFKMCILDLDGNRQFQLYCFQNGKL